MKDKFIRVISPITLAVVCVLDLGTIGYGIFAIKRLIQFPSTPVILFAALDVAALIIAVLVTKEIISNGVKFYDDEFEFTALDENNIFAYDSIKRLEIAKDDSASFTKDFFDRCSVITLGLDGEKEIAVDLGLTTKGTLKRIADEISERTNIEYTELKPKKKAKKDDTEEKDED